MKYAIERTTFKYGDRVVCCEGNGGCDCEYTGTLVIPCASESLAYVEHYLYIVRDDGVQGSGRNGEWRFDWELVDLSDWYYCRLIEQAQVGPASADAHIMGLSPEVIDREAYDSFMRDL